MKETPTMITLHGFPYSNYYNIVKHVMLYKGIAFSEDINYGGTEDYLNVSPVGKIPSLTTDEGGHLSESSVCCDYLEETYPDKPLYPGDSYDRACVRQIMKISELYLELPCRRLLMYVFSNTEPPEAIKADIKQTVERGVKAMTKLCRFKPYIFGNQMTMADIYVRYVMSVVNMAGNAKLGWDIMKSVPGMNEWFTLMGGSDISQKVDADMKANEAGFFEMIQQRMGN